MLLLLNPMEGVGASAGVSIPYTADMNTRLMLYLQAYYASNVQDLTTLLMRYLSELSGDWTARMSQAMQAATAAMAA